MKSSPEKRYPFRFGFLLRTMRHWQENTKACSRRRGHNKKRCKSHEHIFGLVLTKWNPSPKKYARNKYADSLLPGPDAFRSPLPVRTTSIPYAIAIATDGSPRDSRHAVPVDQVLLVSRADSAVLVAGCHHMIERYRIAFSAACDHESSTCGGFFHQFRHLPVGDYDSYSKGPRIQSMSMTCHDIGLCNDSDVPNLKLEA
jgi:hypothetical protein